MRAIVRLICLGLGLLVITVIAITCWAAFSPQRAHADYTPADVIVVFGAGMSADGTLHAPSRLRVQRGVALFNAGRAPNMHFTGGRAVPNGPSAGAQMAAMALEMGVPGDVITREQRSLSTLQNALFSQPFLDQYTSAILVSEGFHLPRVAAAIRWAGGPRDLQLAASTRFRGHPTKPKRAAARMIAREAAAWWFNTARAGAYTVAGWAGVDAPRREGWLD